MILKLFLNTDIYKNIEEYKTTQKRKILIVTDGMITDMLTC